MKIYVGADHQGFHLKEEVLAYLSKHGYEVEDVGGTSLDPNDDFPTFAQAVALKVLGSDDTDPRGVLLCGGGQGMAMAANRFRGIRNDNDSNVISLPARIFTQLDNTAWQGVLETWLNTPFAAAVRYKRRNAELDELS